MPAVRLIFSYEGSDITLVSRQQVDVATPPDDPIEADLSERSGFWVEVRDDSERPLSRRQLHDPIRHDEEVFSDDPEQSVARVPVDTPSGVFAVLVPDIEEADHVALIGTPMEERPALAPAREIARFSLRATD